MKAILLVLLALADAPAAGPVAYACSGETLIKSPGGSIKAGYESSYKVDVARMLWCAGGCAEWRPITALTEQTITLEDTRGAGKDGLRVYTTIDRTTGAHASSVFSGSGKRADGVDMKGRCLASAAAGG